MSVWVIQIQSILIILASPYSHRPLGTGYLQAKYLARVCVPAGAALTLTDSLSAVSVTLCTVVTDRQINQSVAQPQPQGRRVQQGVAVQCRSPADNAVCIQQTDSDRSRRV